MIQKENNCEALTHAVTLQQFNQRQSADSDMEKGGNTYQ